MANWWIVYKRLLLILAKRVWQRASSVTREQWKSIYRTSFHFYPNGSNRSRTNEWRTQQKKREINDRLAQTCAECKSLVCSLCLGNSFVALSFCDRIVCWVHCGAAVVVSTSTRFPIVYRGQLITLECCNHLTIDNDRVKRNGNTRQNIVCIHKTRRMAMMRRAIERVLLMGISFITKIMCALNSFAREKKRQKLGEDDVVAVNTHFYCYYSIFWSQSRYSLWSRARSLPVRHM